MNTALRTMPMQFSWRKLISVDFSKQTVLISGLVILLFTSAFAVVYLKDLNRRLFIQDQSLQQTRQNQQLLWGKLLLEQSTLSTQARIQQIAEYQLGMIVPKPSDIVLVEENG